MNAPEKPAASVAFATTRWTRVLAAKGDSAEARQSLSDLCEAYYQPVFRFIQRQGQSRSEDDARELTHEFFARILERHGLSGADPARGRFRSYLLGAVKHYLSDARDHAHRLKRGGGAAHEPIVEGTDTSPGLEIPDASALPPEVWFDRQWALTLLDRALTLLAAEMAEAGKASHFEVLQPWLTGEGQALSQAEAAAELEMTEGAVKVAIHRLRKRFRALVKTEIASTVGEPGQVTDELNRLIEALGA